MAPPFGHDGQAAPIAPSQCGQSTTEQAPGKSARQTLRSRRRRGRGEGSVSQRSDGLWHARISLGGGKRRSLYAHTKQALLAKLDSVRAGLAAGDASEVQHTLVMDFLDSWTASLQVRPKTLAQYKTIVRVHLKPAIGHVKLRSLTVGHIDDMLGSMAKRGASPRLRELTYVVLKCALGKALKTNRVSRNVCDAVARPRVPVRDVRVLDEAQAAKLMQEAAHSRLKALFGLAIETGMRFGELLGLQWRDVDLGDAGSITVRHTLQEFNGRLQLAEPKTRSSRRRIRVSPTAVAELQAHRERVELEGIMVTDLSPVFCDRNGGWLRQGNVSRRVFKPLLKAAKLPPMRFHDLRHTAATLMLARGVIVQVVSQKLGHRDIVTTLKVYGHLLPSMEEQAALTMAKSYSRIWVA